MELEAATDIDELCVLIDGDVEKSTVLTDRAGFDSILGPNVKPAIAGALGSMLGTHDPVGTRTVLTIPAAMATGKASMAKRASPAIASFHVIADFFGAFRRAFGKQRRVEAS